MSNPLHCLIISYQCNFEGNRSWLRVHTPFHMIETFYNLGQQLCFSKIHVCFLQTHAVLKMKVNLISLNRWAYLLNFHVRSFVRPSESPRSYKDWGGSWVTCCCKTVRTLVRRIAILAESVQLCPMTSENSSSQIFLNCHPIVWMDDLAYAWVQWKNFAATHWLESTCLLLQPRNFDRKFWLRHETACWISARTMVCIPK